MMLAKILPLPSPRTMRNKSRPMPDSFNAIALDIMETLDCAKLMEDAINDLKPGFGNSNEINGNILSQSDNVRRRLQEDVAGQHVDDGGFSDKEVGEADKNNEAITDDVPQEKSGDQAQAMAGDQQ